jgi:N-acetylglucosaminyl-diphospho-decaprenol L-rhamnosyltransferase
VNTPKAQEVNQVAKGTGQTFPVELSIIIVNWNSKDYVRKCIQSIYANARAVTFEIIVVDGASYDGCGEMLGHEFPAVRFVQSQTNAGFAAGNNLGAGISHGRVLLFLNPDTEIIGNALDRLFETLNRLPNAGMAGAKLLNSDGTLQTTCIQSFPTVLNQVLASEFLRRIFPRSRLWGIKALSDETQNPSSVEVISGACMMIKRSIFRKVSGFDERFFMYSEDLDLCYRVREAGFDCRYVPGAQITHHGGGSSRSARSMFSIVMTRESIFRFLRFHRGQSVAWLYRAAMGISSLIRLPLIATSIGAKRLAGKKINGDSFHKWIFILRWSAGLESWAKKSGAVKGGAARSYEDKGPGATPGAAEVKQCAA